MAPADTFLSLSTVKQRLSHVPIHGQATTQSATTAGHQANCACLRPQLGTNPPATPHQYGPPTATNRRLTNPLPRCPCLWSSNHSNSHRQWPPSEICSPEIPASQPPSNVRPLISHQQPPIRGQLGLYLAVPVHGQATSQPTTATSHQAKFVRRRPQVATDPPVTSLLGGVNPLNQKTRDMYVAVDNQRYRRDLRKHQRDRSGSDG
ncbi:hypothetical protein Nepgr_030546 [Nepenthes gracilis]|uniref:Uncharacterized protein n=1 Tax=Nepenthes gracilis TaxID=150966 RepID=A0AAD3TGR4_NEPGR|nr:hypothetical protein Nepgr_030546 [Nepenthes gracilis]